MAKILVIGNSSSGHAAVETLAKNGTHEITVITNEPFGAYYKEFLFDYIAGVKKEKELIVAGEDFYRGNKINLVKNAEVIKLDVKRNRATTKDGAKFPFDYCIIASGTKVLLPDLPGKTKEGVFTWGGLHSAKIIKQRLDITHTVCLLGDTSICRSLADILLAKGKEVKIIANPIPEGFVSNDAVEWIDTLNVSEIIAEGAELRAIKLSNGKAIGTSLVIFTSPMIASTDFLKETDVIRDSGFVVVDNTMRTNCERVFACGSVALIPQMPVVNKDKSAASSEGVLAATTILSVLEGSQSACQPTS